MIGILLSRLNDAAMMGLNTVRLRAVRHRHPPDEDELQLSDLSSDDMKALNDAAWAAFWG